MRSILFFLCCLPLQVLASSPPYHKIADVSLAGTLALQHYRLANGLQVAIIEDDTRPVVTCHLAYRVGSAHEVPGQQGMAHLVEHLAMDRTFLESLGLLGAPHANASTSRDGTKYYATVPKARLDTLIAYFARDMTQFNISEKEYDLEKEVVLSEWARSAKSAQVALQKTLRTHVRGPSLPVRYFGASRYHSGIHVGTSHRISRAVLRAEQRLPRHCRRRERRGDFARCVATF